MNNLSGAKIFLTGGTGSFGRQFVNDKVKKDVFS